MSVYLGWYDYKKKLSAEKNGCTPILIHPGKGNQYSELSPYRIKIDDVLVENKYQFSKLYPSVTAQHQMTYLEGKWGKQLVWEHPAERHIKPESQTKSWRQLTKDDLTMEYWDWRKKGMTNPHAVRYPNGFKGKQECVCAVTDDLQFIDYLEGREIYINGYLQSDIRENAKYKKLQDLLKKGHDLMILDCDGPTKGEGAPYDQLSSQVEDSYLEVTDEVYQQARNNPNRPFGHGWVISGMLLGII